MPRPFTDVSLAISGNPIKNGSAVVSTLKTGAYDTLDTYVKNTPILADIDNKYGYNFYNGLFVHIVGSGNS